ncbi:MAG: 3-dehydroquinate synthase II [Desulfovibrionaceae bacterium]|nr:3-dehydroquinate synthase II [Desulfovibrionaceae bacterium]
MARLYYKSEPYDKNAITLALESGVDGIFVAREHAESVRRLARCQVFALEDTHSIALTEKKDEEEAVSHLKNGETTVICAGWEVIPIENLLAQSDNVLVEVRNAEEATLACGILERGVFGIVIGEEALPAIKRIVAECRTAQKTEQLIEARITKIAQAGLGHRVCVDTLSMLNRGEGMLVGNSSAFTFLVHAETEKNEYVAARPFRINAGGVHAYTRLMGDTTRYLCELSAGREILIVNADGKTKLATVGRVKIEIRPMLLIEAEAETEQGVVKGGIFLQNAETIRLTQAGGNPVSVVSLAKGDTVLCRTDAPGRHFGMRVDEAIQEV